MLSDGSDAAPKAELLSRWPHAALCGGVGIGLFLVGRSYGGYEVSSWAPLGAVLVAAALLAALRRRPPWQATAAACFLLALGGWSLLSVTWGGLPGEAWTTFDQSILGAAALLFGSLIASEWARRAVAAGVLAGVTALAIEVLIRLALDAFPASWFDGRTLEGPVSDHNAQAALFALGIPIAVWGMTAPRAWARAVSGGAGALLLGGLLLTQSRGTLGALALALVVQVAWSRSARIVLASFLTATACVVLLLPLRSVDSALVQGTASEQANAFDRYVLWVGLACLLVGLASALPVPASRARPLVAALTVLLVLGGAAATVAERDALGRAKAALSELTTNELVEPSAGETRFTSLTFSGRRDAWRVARLMFAAHPLTGEGEGRFAARWAEERRLRGLYIVQPHSLELELLGEQGLVGFLLFAGFATLLVWGMLSGPERLASAAALAAFTVLLARASVDYTWSFPGLVAPALLFAGVVGRPGTAAAARTRRHGIAQAVAAGVLAVVLLASFSAPYFAHRHLVQATKLATSDPREAWDETVSGRQLNPWDPELILLQGRIAEKSRDYRLAADRYGSTAETSFYPWLDRFWQARALAEAGLAQPSRALCRQAMGENPGEELLKTGPCADDLLVSAEPDRAHPRGLAGATLSGVVYIFATAPANASAVRFFVDDPRTGGEPFTVEETPPFDLAGGNATFRSGAGDAKPFDTSTLADGRHRVTAVIEQPGAKSSVVSAVFSVANGRAS